jgi:hypothetical protein
VQLKRTALRGVKEILSYQYSLVEKQTLEECPYTPHSERAERPSRFCIVTRIRDLVIRRIAFWKLLD